MKSLPRLYAILDPSCFRFSDQMLKAAKEWVTAGVTMVQYRNKSGNAKEMLADARAVKEEIAKVRGASPLPTDGTNRDVVQLIMNDRADLCLAAEFDGVHVGQDDLSPESVRKIIGPSRWLGVSTHNPKQVT